MSDVLWVRRNIRRTKNTWQSYMIQDTLVITNELSRVTVRKILTVHFEITPLGTGLNFRLKHD